MKFLRNIKRDGVLVGEHESPDGRIIYGPCFYDKMPVDEPHLKFLIGTLTEKQVMDMQQKR